LSVLDDEEHQHANNIGERIDDQLPSVTSVKERSAYEPNESYQADRDKCGTRAGQLRGILRDTSKPRCFGHG
jgi:hypothetical protein